MSVVALTLDAPALAARKLRSGSKLVGLGAARPEGVASATQLGAPFGKPGEWVEARTGIKALHRLRPDESATGLAQDAARHALDDARLDAADVDLVIMASCSLTEDETHRAARAIAPTARDYLLNVACSGFCYALAAADAAIRVRDADIVLVVGVEHMSRMLDPDDLGTSIIFGDGAGAAIVTAADGDDVGVGPVVWGSDGAGADLIATAKDGSGRLLMAGQQVFRWAVDTMPELVQNTCNAAGIALADIDVFVPHQANYRIIDAIARRVGLDRAIIADDIAGAGNTSAASVPMALRRLVDEGRARSGQLALLLGFGAGLSYAGQVIVLP